MADRVVIAGASRAGNLLPAADLRQMAGRAGRGHGSTGFVDLVLTDEETSVADDMEVAEFLVESGMGDLDKMIFHVMPEVASGRVRSEKDVRDWFSSSLFVAQGGVVSPSSVVSYLKEIEAIQDRGGSFEATMVGELAAKFYFHPADILAWKMNFTRLFRDGIHEEDLAPAWALGNVPVKRASGYFGNKDWVLEDCLSRMPTGLYVEEGCVVSTVLWWHCTGGPSIGGMKSLAMAFRDDFSRIQSMLVEMDAEQGWGMGNWILSHLRLRVMLGLPPWLVPLCALPGIKKGMAAYLYSLGVREASDINQALLDSLDVDEVGESFLAVVRRLV